MKRLWIVLLVVIASLALAATPQVPPDLAAKAEAFVDTMAKGDFAKAAEGFDATMKAALTPDKLAAVWQALGAQAGAYKGRGKVYHEKYMQYDILYVECRFERIPLEAKVVFDPQKLIAGLYFVPPSEHAQAPPAASPVPAVKPDLFVESDVTVGFGDWKLPGKLTMPKGAGPFPGVVLLHGSGPNDMDESVGAAKPFQDLAHGLASKGVAVLRYDKRTKVYAEKMAASKDTMTVREEVIQDAFSAVSLLRETKGVDPARVFLLGHSLGAMLAPRIAAAKPDLAGIVIMAGNTRPLEDLIVEQLTYIASLPGASDAEKAQCEAIKAQAAKLKTQKITPDTPASELPFGAPAAYWLDLRAYDQVKTASSLTIPILILQGGRDYQVTTKDFEGWKKALEGKPNVTLKLYPACNHLFIEGQGPSTPQEYMKPGHVSQQVVDDVAAWILAQKGK